MYDAVLQCQRRILSQVQEKENEPAKDNGAMWYRACRYDVDYGEMKKFYPYTSNEIAYF